MVLFNSKCVNGNELLLSLFLSGYFQRRRVCRVEQEVLAQIFSHMDPPGPEQRLAVELHSPTSSMTMSTDSTSPAEDMTSTSYVYDYVAVDSVLHLYCTLMISQCFRLAFVSSSSSKWSGCATICRRWSSCRRSVG